MCPVFFCADFWDGGCLTRLADWGAVCGFGRSGRQNSVGNLIFCLLCGPREPDLESAVEHFFKFWRFCSTLEPARA